LKGKNLQAIPLSDMPQHWSIQKSFLKWKYGAEDLDIRKLNHDTMQLAEIQKCNHNSTSFPLKRLF
jgi:hypothetical protein